MPRGLLLILSGPSGVGKDTLIDAWSALDPDVVRVVACTTRAPREGELNAIDYHFLTEEEFLHRAEQGRFLEYKKVHDKYYGTPLDQVEELLRLGKTAILKIDVQGALEVMEKRPDAATVFILPPNLGELERRLRSRKTDTPEQIEMRLETSRQEMAHAVRYKYHIKNDNLDEAVKELANIKGISCPTSSSE